MNYYLNEFNKFNKYSKLADWFMSNPEALSNNPKQLIYANLLNNKLSKTSENLFPEPSDFEDFPEAYDDSFIDNYNYAYNKANTFNNYYNSLLDEDGYNIENTSLNNYTELNNLFDMFGNSDGSNIPNLSRDIGYAMYNTKVPIYKNQLAQQPAHVLRRIYNILANKE